MEGRVLLTHHWGFVLLNVYAPALTIEEDIKRRMAIKMELFKVCSTNEGQAWRV